MALIRIERNEESEAFAKKLELAVGARVTGWTGNVLNIEGKDGGDLYISRGLFDVTRQSGPLIGEDAERAWRSLVLHREGEAEVNPSIIIVRNPVERQRGYLLEFDDIEEKDAVMAMAKRLGYDSTRAFVLDAVRKEMEAWAEQGMN